MGTPRNPLFGFDSRHVIDININAEQVLFMVQAIVDYLTTPSNERMERLEDQMRQVKTLLREFREGLDALKADEASDDARDEANTLTIEQRDARIKELEDIKTELEARPSLSEAQQQQWDDMVVELGQLTGNVITDDEDEVPDPVVEPPAEDTEEVPGPDTTDPDQGNDPLVP